MDCLAQIMSEKHSNPFEFLKQLRQTTEPIGGGMEYCDNGEYVEYDVAVEAVKKAQQQIIDKADAWLRMTMDFFNNGEFNTDKSVNDFKEEMKGE